ncbi:nicotianamine synthase family protein [Pseudoalteromonas umbrosa]|uniref:nicotianamine synthase family protein n=1 Tax=Pseudoalteromonas umbrosa TaxID=3048489 RepID=UPI0024C44B3A|nr:nicotianamine synthase family protein [Pseudoalteromonas sp. B95]MDK1285788.1 nicotianamine synthase family protein [Pseudoalteromonas sp. B95]
MNISNQALVHATKIVDGFQHIKSMSALEITPENMTTFHQFLDLLSNEHGSDFADNVLAQQEIQAIKPGIQQLFSQASSLYERHWAERIVKSSEPKLTLSNEYPYYKHYQRATGLEINAIHSLAATPVRNVLMVGSGALPLTTLALHQSGLSVDNLDINGPDLLLGQQVCDALSEQHQMKFIHNDICEQGNLDQYDVIWLAALVGDESLKEKIIAHLYAQMKPGAQLVVRTAYNLRTLLYPSIDEQGLAPFQLKLKIQTYADNFHSILIAQKPE